MSNVNDVLKQLYAQRKVKLRFNSEADRDNFRQNLYKYKKTQDEAALAILDEVKQKLRYLKETHEGQGEYDATFWLEDKKEISFEIISIEETPVKEQHGEKKVSANLGEADSRSGESTSGQDNLRDNAS